ncbi:hypothetical protein [Peribacillus alkalitolerans]|uniref:hypothetical protein n=1 Tax=Peribacillus alkalitolerans TaxID=1550385 RepID=UPI0013D01331|nr:hypothetical protein [Peribacillus alkalitolerans]
MTNKESILKLIDSELQKLISISDIKIAALMKENQNLKLEMTRMNDQNQSLKLEMTRLKAENKILNDKLSRVPAPDNYKQKYETLLKYIHQLSNGISHELIEEWCLSSSIEDAFMLLQTCEKLVDENNLDLAQYILELLSHNPRALLQENEEIRYLFQRILSKILIEQDNPNETFDEIYWSCMELIMTLNQSSLKDTVSDFMINRYYQLLENVLYLNNPDILVKFMRASRLYDLRLELNDAFYQILDVEWEFIDSSLEKDHFTFLLWYSYLFDFDDRLLEVAKDSLQWFSESNNDLSLYFYLYDSINKRINPTKDTYNFVTQKFNASSVLTTEEKEEVLLKVDSVLKPLLVKKDSVAPYVEKLHLIKKEQVNYFIKQHNLTKQRVSIPLFKGKNENKVIKFIETDLLYTPKQKKGFLTKEELDQLLKSHHPLVPKPKDYTGFVINNNVISSFKWPETEVNEASTKQELEEKTLSENSALKLMGYQITGVNRVRRWEILEKAVPVLGLKKVANIIAYNVKLRKGQKNGRDKYHNAITEWEYDLAKLKKQYYKQEFNWPIT